MFYLTYRPKTIQDIDNTKVREVVRKYLAVPEIPHAWLFTGHKGMGKTSVARILAKELCKTGDASMDKRIVADIENGVSPDVQEINGADNTGIDDIRKLIENISYTPMMGKYRMYIIDEVHMLSTSAFNGLLKILEEPPSHAIFILATTAIDKIPPTIQSRCVRVEFGVAKPEDVVRMLERIEKGEKLTIPSATKTLIANNCDRSFRDATKILEELVAQKALDPESAQQYLGVRAKDKLLTFLEGKNTVGAIQWLQEYSLAGGDPKLLIEETIRRLHALMLKLNGVEPDYPIDDVNLTPVQVAKLLKLFHEAYAVSRVSPVAQTAIQVAVIEYCQQN
ncbi:DNA polymerase III subunit gamma/tau [Candidatus Woesebacteria bacterium]|nr:DNA polymerase III subunit gamma/tau [Candidatus Woesebacteria bacterium]